MHYLPKRLEMLHRVEAIGNMINKNGVPSMNSFVKVDGVLACDSLILPHSTLLNHGYDEGLRSSDFYA